MFISNGILFNHESPRRGSNFVTNKIIKTAVEIKKGKKNKLVLGNLDAKRDWGHSYDYVRAMHKILNYEIPMDFIVSTGTTRSVRDLCEITFNKLGLNYLDYVVTDKKYMRPEELKFLCGDSSEIRKVLNWSPKYTFDKMIDEMIEFWVKVVKN
jgi:GDPmannose 4,6-dehydratase